VGPDTHKRGTEGDGHEAFFAVGVGVVAPPVGEGAPTDGVILV